MEISIENHKASLVAQQAEFDAQLSAKSEEIADLQTELANKDAEITAITADRDRIAKLLADASAAFDAGDVAKLSAMRAAELQTENEKKLAAARAKKAEAEAEIAELT